MLDVIRKWTPEQRALLTALYETGIPFADIAAEINSKFGTNYTGKAIVMQGFVLSLRRPARVPGSQWTEEQNAEIRRHVEAGLPHRAIAKAMDVKAGSLWHQLRRLGLNRTEEQWQAACSQKRAIKERHDDKQRYAARMGHLLNFVPAQYREEKPLPPVCEVVDDPLNLSLAEVGHKQCRWIMNEDLAEAQYCGHPTARKSWCARHAAVVATWCDDNLGATQ